jgi:hypothetical protein
MKLILYRFNGVRISDLHYRYTEAQVLVARTTPLFSNFLFTNLCSIKFLYFFIISSLFSYLNSLTTGRMILSGTSKCSNTLPEVNCNRYLPSKFVPIIHHVILIGICAECTKYAINIKM